MDEDDNEEGSYKDDLLSLDDDDETVLEYEDNEELEATEILLAFLGLKQALTSNLRYHKRVTKCQEVAQVLLEASGDYKAKPFLYNAQPKIIKQIEDILLRGYLMVDLVPPQSQWLSQSTLLTITTTLFIVEPSHVSTANDTTHEDSTNTLQDLVNELEEVDANEENNGEIMLLALVFSPTRELLMQIHENARKFSYQFKVTVIVAHGGASTNQQMHNLENGANMLVVATRKSARRRRLSLSLKVPHPCFFADGVREGVALDGPS
ncbi:hypothetical protein Fmac_015703 [Flemingia macrophylla]|uniref:DEAD/DEAH-box helicase domain-containing protein n=1 Tax=Flemingia macrophylla TaxID=520843 RepID=A0ABD1MHE8_9FABA